MTAANRDTPPREVLCEHRTTVPAFLAADVIANGQTHPLAGHNRFVTGEFRFRTMPGESVEVGEVKLSCMTTDPSGWSELFGRGSRPRRQCDE